MRSLEEMLKEFPAMHPSHASGEQRQAWYFLLEDGKLSGGGDIVNHYGMMALTEEEKYDSQASKRGFCNENHVLRVCYSHSHLYVEIFDWEPNDAQWAAIGTLFRRDRDTVIVWDVWLQQDQKWLHGEGSIGQFKRAMVRRTHSRSRLRRHSAR